MGEQDELSLQPHWRLLSVTVVYSKIVCIFAVFRNNQRANEKTAANMDSLRMLLRGFASPGHFARQHGDGRLRRGTIGATMGNR